MAALLVRSLLPSTNNNGRGKHSILRASSPVSDEERSSSFDSGIAMCEKPTKDDARSLPARINPRLISDATIGLSDGLTVPFALTAGLAALGDSSVVIYGGLAELVAGGISMGLGGYLGAKSEAEAYQAALAETRATVANDRWKAASLIRGAFSGYDFSERALDEMTTTLLASPHQACDFIMKFHHQLVEADHAASRAYLSGITIALGYVLGGVVALLPYVFVSSIDDAFVGSVIVMALALFAFGWVKTSLVGESDRWICLKNGVQMTVLGGVAAGAATLSVKAIGS